MKKKIYFALFSMFMFSGIQGHAQDRFSAPDCFNQQERIYDYDFNQEKMKIHNSKVYLISTFENKDFLTCYNFQGERLWNVPFQAKITSWRMSDDIIMVFSKSRTGESTYLTCMDAWTGAVLWQRP